MFTNKLITILGVGFLLIHAYNAFEKKATFEGYSLIKIVPENAEQLELIDQWQNNAEFDVWSGQRGVNSGMSVFLSPRAFLRYSSLLKANGIPFEILQRNFQKVLDEEALSLSPSRSKQQPNNKNNALLKYARYSEIITYVNGVAEDNKDIASTYVIGTTHENRLLTVLLIKTGENKKGVWLDCGIHAREWISPATCTWFINRLIQDYRNKDPVVVGLLNKYEFHILPVVNPDGYEFTHTSNRLWRKNRAPNPGSTCIGTDLNRNFDHKWMVSGSSDQPCSDTFAGSGPGSELETKAIKNAVNAKLNNWEVFFTLHSYGQYWMFPYAYALTPRSPHYDLLKRKSQIGADALRARNGTVYKIGTVPELLYSASGGSFDWTHGVANIKHSYCLELRPDGNALNGFVLAEKQIPDTVEESYVGMITLIDSISQSPDN